MVQLEGEARSAQQKAMQSLRSAPRCRRRSNKAHSELSLTGRRLTESDKTLAATQNRLKAVEAGLAEAQSRPAAAVGGARRGRPKHLDAMNMQNSRFQALQARASLTENLLEEARQALTARADEIRSFERRVIKATTAHDNSGEKIAQLTAALDEREDQIREFEQSHAALHDHNQMLAMRWRRGRAPTTPRNRRSRSRPTWCELLEKQLQAARKPTRCNSISSTRSCSASSSNGAWPRARCNPAARTSPGCCAKSAPCSTARASPATPHDGGCAAPLSQSGFQE